MIYVGVAARLLSLDMQQVEKAVRKQFKRKQKAADLNMAAVKAGYDYAASTLTKTDPFVVQSSNQTEGKVIMAGNAAAALGCMFAGVTVVTWYPITPSSSLVETLIDYLRRFRVGADGRATFAVVQAEDELAAIGMVLGAGWAGARAMTSTSGPGISLMTEFAGMGYFAEIPGVIWDIQRIGPSTGLPTRTSQADLRPVYFLGHGDTRQVVLLPGTMKECFEFGWRAFDLAERLQTPVFVLSDLDLGMNAWMTEPFDYPDQPMDRGKVLSKEDLDRLGGQWARFKDVDGDGIPYRTLPGNEHPNSAYFTRGTGHNTAAVYSERPDDWEQNLIRLEKKHETARTLVPKAVVDNRKRADGQGSEIGIIAYGSTHDAINEARDQLRAQRIETDFCRVRALPFEDTLREFIDAHKRLYVVELSMEAQLRSLIQLYAPDRATDLYSVAHLDGLPLTASYVRNGILEQEKK